MWMFSETGFVSAVQDKKNPKKLVVRGRDRKSLEPLAKFARTKIIEGGGTDYPFRVYVTRSKFGQWVAEQIENLDYTNYKGRMYSTRPDFGTALHNVWDDMHDVSPKKAVGFGFAASGASAYTPSYGGRDDFDFEDEHPSLAAEMRRQNYERDVWGDDYSIPMWKSR